VVVLLLVNLLLLSLLAAALWQMLVSARLRARSQAELTSTLAAAPQASIATPSMPASEPEPSFRSFSAVEVFQAPDVYADPIDGVPFTMEESVHACACGVGYRAESVEWLASHLGGLCVHCGAQVAMAAIA